MKNFLQIERRDRIVILTMNQPEQRNPLTGSSASVEFAAACEAINADASVSVAILTGAGPAFSTGGNLKDMARYLDNPPPAEAIRDEYRHGIQRITRSVYGLAVPLIAAVNGPAMGAGCDLACMADIRIASENARFAESFVKVGLIPGDGGSWLLPRAVGRSKAAEMTFTGDALDAQQALACGLVSSVVAPDQLMPSALALAERIARNDATVLRMSKQLLREGEQGSLGAVLDLASTLQPIAHTLPAHHAAVRAFLDRKK